MSKKSTVSQVDQLIDNLSPNSKQSKDMDESKEPEFSVMTPSGILKYLLSLKNKKLIEILGDPCKSESSWTCTECGDGNINYIFLVKGVLNNSKDSVVVKQAPPFLRLVGPSWKLKQERIKYEIMYHKSLALNTLHSLPFKCTPEMYYSDCDNYHLFVMENLCLDHKMVVFRSEISNGIGIKKYPNLGNQIGLVIAHQLFRTSDLNLSFSQKFEDLSTFNANYEMRSITELVIFEEPFCVCSNNRYDSRIGEYKELCPSMVESVGLMRSDYNVIANVYNLRRKFRNLHQSLVHGDLHTGSVMVNENRACVIDAEFCYYGPMFVDIGLFIGNMLLACFSQELYDRSMDERTKYIKYLQNQTVMFYNSFADKFIELWDENSKGNLVPFSIAKNKEMISKYKKQFMNDICIDSMLFAAIVCIRRVLGIADAPEFRIGNDKKSKIKRWNAECKVLKFANQVLSNKNIEEYSIEQFVNSIDNYL